MPAFESAQSYFEAGLNVIPCHAETKKPTLNSWGEYESQRVNPNLLRLWFASGQNRLAIICGAISGNLELIDIDDYEGDTFERWKALVDESQFGLVDRLLIEVTPRKGIHIAYRCSEGVIPGNQKLASRVTSEGEIKTLIETRGEGGYFLCAPNAGYDLQQGEFSSLPDIRLSERDILLWAARKLNEVPEDAPEPTPERVSKHSFGDSSPADEYCASTSFRQILEPHGWQYLFKKGDNEHYCRPGKRGETSATVKSDEVMFVFSSNASPFEPSKGYSKFQAMALLEHGGNESAAASEIVKSRPSAKYRAVQGSPARAFQWGSSEETEGEDLPQPISIDGLLDFVPEDDKASILGNRWLCEGGSALLIGQAGIGKSTLITQMSLTWSYGKPVFGIKPRGELRSLFIQAENDDGDIAEMIQGVVAGMGLNARDPALRAHLKDKLIIVRDSSRTGPAFCQMAEELIRRHQPDLVFADPLLSYVGGDLSRQDVCAAFLRNNLNPVLQRTKVGWIWAHHSGKPPKDAKAMENWTDADYSYMGIGSSDLTNWARAIGVVLKADKKDPIYNFNLTKRAKRAGMIDEDGNPATSICLEHSNKGSCWIQRQPIVAERTVRSPKMVEKEKEHVDTVMAKLPLKRADILSLIVKTFDVRERRAEDLWKKHFKSKVELKGEVYHVAEQGVRPIRDFRKAPAGEAEDMDSSWTEPAEA